MFELSRCFRPGNRIFGNIDPFVFSFVKLREIQNGREVKFPNKSGCVPGFAENISDIRFVAFQCDIEIGKPLVFFAAYRFGVKFAMRITSKPTGQEAVSRWSTDRAADVGASEFHSFLRQSVEVGSVSITSKGGNARWVLIVDQEHDNVGPASGRISFQWGGMSMRSNGE